MKKIGLLVITIGFIIGSLSTILHETEVRWGMFFTALSVGIIGIILVKISEKKVSQSKEVLTQNIENIERSLGNIVKNVKMLNTQKDEINTYDVHHKIDELFLEDINTFVEARESISHTYGMQDYAEIMTSFAAGERYLNRVWSASADGYIDEVSAFLDKTCEQFEDSLKKLQACEA